MVSNGIVAISGLTIANGNCLGDFNDGGGGIKNVAALTLRNCLITSNFALQNGGGVFNQATLTVRDSLITSNTGSILGGGIANLFGGTTTIIGSTICSNNAVSSGWVTAGGILNAGGLIVSNSTVSGNQRYGILHYGATIGVASSTLANNQQGDIGVDTGDPNSKVTIRNSIINNCGGWPITSEDYNLVQSTAFGTWFVGATNHNIYGQDPKLGPLADNGGPTPTHALRFDSPAIDAGHSGGATTDQRGLPRPIDDPNIPNAGGGDGCDIGAYESDPNLKITGIEAAGTEVRVGFNSVFGRNYRLESEGNLNNSWTTLSNNITGTGSTHQTLNVGMNNMPQQFYHMVLSP